MTAGRSIEANRCVIAIPIGWTSRPVLVLDVLRPQYTVNPDGTRRVTNGFGEGELSAFVAAIEAEGGRAEETWNGRSGAVTGSVQLTDLAFPSLAAAVNRYLSGCPTHHTTLCCVATDERCTWYGDGRVLVVPPGGAS